MSCFHILSWRDENYESDENVLVFKKLLGKISSTKYRWANKEDEKEKQDKGEDINIFC